MNFKRARNDEQRTERRRTILDTAAAMLTEMPVAKLSLNELSRRVCLAKSNVLRYFESREAVLLELLDTELHAWLADLERDFAPTPGTARERGDRLAALIADSLAARPVLCELISAQATVLEHNVSTDVAVRHKRAAVDAATALARFALRHMPEFGEDDGAQLAGIGVLTVSAAWPYSQPPPALLAAYEVDPALTAMRIEFSPLVRRALEVTISGLLARRQER